MSENPQAEDKPKLVTLGPTNETDPSKQAYQLVQRITKSIFHFAELLLVTGIFAYLAEQVDDWSVRLIAFVLVALSAYITLSLHALIRFNWRGVKRWPVKALLLVLDMSVPGLGLGIFWQSYYALLPAMRAGIGI
jgi:hypothetical protein